MKHTMKHSLTAALTASRLLPACAAAQGSGLNFLARGPIARYTAADMRLLERAVGQALKGDQVGNVIEWSNEKTGASGEITPQRIFESAGLPCRELRVALRSRNRESSGLYTLCQRDGRWKLAD